MIILLGEINHLPTLPSAPIILHGPHASHPVLVMKRAKSRRRSIAAQLQPTPYPTSSLELPYHGC